MRCYIDLVQYFDSDSLPSKYGVIILNQEISSRHFQTIYSRASMRICADGGFDRLQEWIERNNVDPNEFNPDFVIGDLDSVSAKKRETKWILDENQDRCDFQKCLDFATTKLSEQTFFVFGALGGRFDHELMSLSVLYEFGHLTLIYVNAQSIILLLTAGRNTITIRKDIFGPHCGFGPLKDTATVTTSGFEWDLVKESLSLGNKISSSNSLQSDESITIETDHPIVLTLELASK